MEYKIINGLPYVLHSVVFDYGIAQKLKGILKLRAESKVRVEPVNGAWKIWYCEYEEEEP